MAMSRHCNCNVSTLGSFLEMMSQHWNYCRDIGIIVATFRRCSFVSEFFACFPRLIPFSKFKHACEYKSNKN